VRAALVEIKTNWVDNRPTGAQRNFFKYVHSHLHTVPPKRCAFGAENIFSPGGPVGPRTRGEVPPIPPVDPPLAVGCGSLQREHIQSDTACKGNISRNCPLLSIGINQIFTQAIFFCKLIHLFMFRASGFAFKRRE